MRIGVLRKPRMWGRGRVVVDGRVEGIVGAALEEGYWDGRMNGGTGDGCFFFSGSAGGAGGDAVEEGESVDDGKGEDISAGISMVCASGTGGSVVKVVGSAFGASSRVEISLAGENSEPRGGGSGGGSSGPNQPSCRPRIYSFHVCLPMTKSPCNPSQCRTLRPLLAFSTRSSASSSGGCVCGISPFLSRSLLILSASSART